MGNFRIGICAATLLLLALTGCGGTSSTPQPPASTPTTRTVTVNVFDTYWGPTGPTQVPSPDAIGLIVAAFVPQPDGTQAFLPGSMTSPGVFSIPNVPIGYYWLNIADYGSPLPAQLLAQYFPPGGYWTSATAIDAGTDVPGPYVQSSSGGNVTLSISGGVQGDTALMYLFGGTNLTDVSNGEQFDDLGGIKMAVLAEYGNSSFGALNAAVLGPEVTDSNLTVVNGTLSEALQPSPQISLSIGVSGAQWMSLFNQSSPTAPALMGFGLQVASEAFVTPGVNATCDAPWGAYITLAVPNAYALGFCPVVPIARAPSSGLLPIDSPNGVYPAPATDQTIGTLQYGDPFPADWAHTLSFWETALVTFPTSNPTVALPLVDGETVAPSDSPLAPLVSQVQGPTIDGANLFSSQTLSTTTPTLSWSPPQTGVPFGYLVEPFTTVSVNGQYEEYFPMGFYFTAKTSVQVFPLTPGTTYVFRISSLVDGGAANVETTPFRSALPQAFSSLVSAPITISSTATPVPGTDAPRMRISPPVNRPSESKQR